MMSCCRIDADQSPAGVHGRDVAVATGLHQVDRLTDGLVEIQRAGFAGHQRLDRLGQVDA